MQASKDTCNHEYYSSLGRFIKYTVEIYYIRYDISGIQGEQDWM